MSATNAWSYMCWLSGIMVGMGLAQEHWAFIIGGGVLSLVSFYALRRFGESP